MALVNRTKKTCNFMGNTRDFATFALVFLRTITNNYNIMFSDKLIVNAAINILYLVRSELLFTLEARNNIRITV